MTHLDFGEVSSMQRHAEQVWNNDRCHSDSTKAEQIPPLVKDLMGRDINEVF